MLYGCLFCNMSPGSLGALGTHLRLYVNEYAEGHRNAHPSNKSTYATKYDNIHHVGMIRCWIGGRQTAVRIPAVRAVKLAYSKDQAEHSALWRFAKNVDVELQDSEADLWKGRDTTITVSWWDERVREVMAGRYTTTAVIRESRVRAGVLGVGRVVVPPDEEDIDEELEFGEWNSNMDAPVHQRPLVQHGDFHAGHRLRGTANEIGNTSAGSAGDMITVKRSSRRQPAASSSSSQRPPSHDKSLRSRGPPAPHPPLPEDTILIDDETDVRPASRKRAGSRMPEYSEPDDYHPPEARARHVSSDDSDIPAPKQRRAPPPAPFTLHVDVFGKFVSVPVTPYSSLSSVITAALTGASRSATPVPGIRGSEPLVRIDAGAYMLIDQWCQEWDEVVWRRIKEKAAWLPQPVVWSCELVEVRRGKGPAGRG